MRLFRRLRALVSFIRGRRDFWTEWLSWLNYANAGMLDRGNVWSMNHAICNLPSNAPVLEIGAFCGLSTNVLTYLLRRNGRTNPLITCDRWQFQKAEEAGLIDDSVVTREQYREFVKDSFMRNVRTFNTEPPLTLEMLSDELFDAWRLGEERQDVFGRSVQLGGPLSFCYIDGNHTYEFAQRDFANCDHFLDTGGFILLDDSSDTSHFESVNQVARDAVKSGRYEVVVRNPNYLLRKLV